MAINFFSACLPHQTVTKIWPKPTVIVQLKPGKFEDKPKGYIIDLFLGSRVCLQPLFILITKRQNVN